MVATRPIDPARRLRLSLGGSLLMATIALTGCGGDDSATDRSGEATEGTGSVDDATALDEAGTDLPNACALSVEEMAAAVGAAVDASTDFGGSCAYTVDGGDAATISVYANAEVNMGGTPVPEVADDAVWAITGVTWNGESAKWVVNVGRAVASDEAARKAAAVAAAEALVAKGD